MSTPTPTTSNSEPYRILHALIRMETHSPEYACPDYLESRRLECASSGRSAYINEVWRSKVCEWFYLVVDRHANNLSREVVSMAMDILDRFLAKTSIDADFEQDQAKSFFQLAALTSLYIGVKVFYRRAAHAHEHAHAYEHPGQFLQEEDDVMSIQSLLRMSTAGFQEDDIRAMTLKVLTTLSWRICPPSALLFVRSILALMDSKGTHVDATLKEDLYENSRFLCELSACDYFFVTYRSSSIALASIMVAMDQQRKNSCSSTSVEREVLLQDIFANTGVNPLSNEIALLRRRLEQIYARSAEMDEHVQVVVDDQQVQGYSDAASTVSSKQQVRVVSTDNLSEMCGQSH